MDKPTNTSTTSGNENIKDEKISPKSTPDISVTTTTTSINNNSNNTHENGNNTTSIPLSSQSQPSSNNTNTSINGGGLVISPSALNNIINSISNLNKIQYNNVDAEWGSRNVDLYEKIEQIGEGTFG